MRLNPEAIRLQRDLHLKSGRLSVSRDHFALAGFHARSDNRQSKLISIRLAF